jgi:hypothetical protein
VQPERSRKNRSARGRRRRLRGRPAAPCRVTGRTAGRHSIPRRKPAVRLTGRAFLWRAAEDLEFLLDEEAGWLGGVIGRDRDPPHRYAEDAERGASDLRATSAGIVGFPVAELRLPSEPIGSIPRPASLIAGMRAKAEQRSARKSSTRSTRMRSARRSVASRRQAPR